MNTVLDDQKLFSAGGSYYLIGPYPPPIGGISVYIYRYGRLLKSQGYDVKYIDFGMQTKFNKILVLVLFMLNPSFAHFHVNGFDFLTMLALTLRVFRGEIIFQDHSGRIVEDISLSKRLILSLFLRRVDKCIFVGDHINEYYFKRGLKLPKNLQIKNAFLPPPPEDEIKIWKSYSSETIEFINNHEPLIVANASQIVIYKEVDLYGIDMCIDLIAKLKDDYPGIGLVFALAEIGNNNYFNKINQRLDDLDVCDKFYFLVGQKELWPIFKQADLSVRPTYNDGYGISVAESLYFGCPAVASDVCTRPVGTELFKNRDFDDLMMKVNEILKKQSI